MGPGNFAVDLISVVLVTWRMTPKPSSLNARYLVSWEALSINEGAALDDILR
jgi:hypothetical protein